MNEQEKQKIKQELLEIYEGYVRNVNDNNIRARAQRLFFQYVYSNAVIDKDLMSAIQGLEHIGWEYSRSTKTEAVWKMNEDEARKMIEKLKK